MFSDNHRQAEILSDKAARARAEEQMEEALKLYAQAAKFEEFALEEVPSHKVRTRSIISVSVASLLYKAQMFEEAELTIFRLLGSKSVQPWAEQQLRDLLPVVSDEKMLASELKRRYSGESITVALRGGEIGSGTGPFDLILEKASGFRNLLYRFAEWIGEYPLRLQGNPPREVMEAIQARATEPAPGSYRLEIRLTEPLQSKLFESVRVRPQAVSDAMFQFLSRLTQGDYSNLEELVPQVGYRKALLQLTRNVTPSGKRIKEIGISRRHKDKIQKIYLTDALPPRIKEVLPRQPKDSREEETEVRGVLRALHLDENWLELNLPPHDERIKCSTVHDMLDDVVGPMVNREVIVRGRTRLRRGVSHLFVEEIELAEEG